MSFISIYIHNTYSIGSGARVEVFRVENKKFFLSSRRYTERANERESCMEYAFLLLLMNRGVKVFLFSFHTSHPNENFYDEMYFSCCRQEEVLKVLYREVKIAGIRKFERRYKYIKMPSDENFEEGKMLVVIEHEKSAPKEFRANNLICEVQVFLFVEDLSRVYAQKATFILKIKLLTPEKKLP